MSQRPIARRFPFDPTSLITPSVEGLSVDEEANGLPDVPLDDVDSERMYERLAAGLDGAPSTREI